MKTLFGILALLIIRTTQAAPIPIPCPFDNGNQCQCVREDSDPPLFLQSALCTPSNGKLNPFSSDSAYVIDQLTVQVFQGDLQIPAASFAAFNWINSLTFQSTGASFPHITLTLDPEAFNGTNMVSQLQIANITNVYPFCDAFKSLGRDKNLGAIYLDSIGDVELTADSFEDFKSLTSLYIRGNLIKSIDDKALNGVGGLMRLELSSAGLTKVPTGLLNNLPSALTSLNLGGNPITSVKVGDFGTNLGTIDELNLDSTKIGVLDLSVLDGMNGLLSLSVQRSGLMNLTVSDSKKVPQKLNEIDLTSSNVQYIDSSLDDILARDQLLRFIIAGDQFLQCSEGYKWMAKYATCPGYPKMLTTGSFCLNEWMDLLAYLETIAPEGTC